MKSKKPKADTVTIAIYKDDWDKLQDLCRKNETFRDKIHQLVEKEEKSE